MATANALPLSRFGSEAIADKRATDLPRTEWSQKSLPDEIEDADSGADPFARAAITFELGRDIVTIRRSRSRVVHTVLLWPRGTREMQNSVPIRVYFPTDFEVAVNVVLRVQNSVLNRSWKINLISLRNRSGNRIFVIVGFQCD
jgi:hypothetical protein